MHVPDEQIGLLVELRRQIHDRDAFLVPDPMRGLVHVGKRPPERSGRKSYGTPRNSLLLDLARRRRQQPGLREQHRRRADVPRRIHKQPEIQFELTRAPFAVRVMGVGVATLLASGTLAKPEEPFLIENAGAPLPEAPAQMRIQLGMAQETIEGVPGNT